MRITGKLVNDTAVQGEKVIIELPAVDKSKIKAGDEVWIRQAVTERKPGDVYFHYLTIKSIDSVVAHFPKQPEPEEYAHQDKDGNPVWEKTIELPLRFSQEYCIDNLIARKINALIDAVEDIARRIK